MIFGHGIMILILLYKVMIAEYLTLWTPCIIFCAITILNWTYRKSNGRDKTGTRRGGCLLRCFDITAIALIAFSPLDDPAGV